MIYTFSDIKTFLITSLFVFLSRFLRRRKLPPCLTSIIMVEVPRKQEDNGNYWKLFHWNFAPRSYLPSSISLSIKKLACIRREENFVVRFEWKTMIANYIWEKEINFSPNNIWIILWCTFLLEGTCSKQNYSIKRLFQMLIIW